MNHHTNPAADSASTNLVESQPAALQIIDSLATFKVIMSSMRMTILTLLARQALSVNQLAAELKVPYTRLYYHLQLLEKHGVVQVVGSRPLPGAAEEKFYRATAYDYRPATSLRTIDGKLNPEWERLTITTILEDIRRNLQKSLSAGLIDLNVRSPHPAALGGTQRPLRLSPARASELHQRLAALANEFVAYAGEDYAGESEAAGQDYLLTTMLFPIIVDDPAEDAVDDPVNDPGENAKAETGE